MKSVLFSPFVSPSPEVKLAASYDDMFQQLLALSPESRQSVKEFIQWAKTTLKKQNRITWYLRWARLTVASRAAAKTGQDTTQVEALYDKYFKELQQKTGADESEIRSGYRDWRHVQGSLAHFYSLNINEIDSYDPKISETPDALFEAFEGIEDEHHEKASNDVKLLQPEAGDEVYIQLGDGWAWWLLNRNYCQAEADAMGHCGNGASSDSSERILSLRQEKVIAGREYWEPHLTFILKHDDTLTEMKGRGNEKPVERYHNAIVALLSDKRIQFVAGGGYRPENNFSVDDLSREDRQKVQEANPSLATSLRDLYYAEGMSERVIKRVQESIDLKYKKGIGFVIDQWDSGLSMLARLGDKKVQNIIKGLVHDHDDDEALDLSFAEVGDDDPVLRNIAQSVINELPGLDTWVRQFDWNSVDDIKRMIQGVGMTYPDSQTFKLCRQGRSVNPEIVEESYRNWREDYGGAEWLHIPKAEDADQSYYLTVEDDEAIEAAENGYGVDDISYPDLEYIPGMIEGDLHQAFEHPIPAPDRADQPRLFNRLESDEEARQNGIHVSSLKEKTAYLSPKAAEITVSIDLGARPTASLSLDLGIPNFTLFKLSFPIADIDGKDLVDYMDSAFDALLDEVAAFMISLKYTDDQTVTIMAAARDCFGSIEYDHASDADMGCFDPNVRMYEAYFDLPSEFVDQTQALVVTAGVVTRKPPVRKLELTPLNPKDKTNSPARIIQLYKNRALRSLPRPHYVIVYDQKGQGVGALKLNPSLQHRLLKNAATAQ